MYITVKKDQAMNITIAILLLLIFIALIKYNSLFLAFLDTEIQKHFINHSVTVVNRGISVLSSPLMGGIYVILLWVIAWGFKHKLIATWAVLTYLIGQLIFIAIQSWANRPRPAGHPTGTNSASFPSHHLFSILLVCYLVWVVAFPWVAENWHRWLIAIALVLLCILVIIARLRMKSNYPFDMVGSFLLAYAWSQLAEIIYLRLFKRLRSLRLFRHSDFN